MIQFWCKLTFRKYNILDFITLTVTVWESLRRNAVGGKGSVSQQINQCNDLRQR